ncbi:hypothetical protein L6164_020800 [Bauhinia variegata]|uniref:Uncharacterized protein n=1 Tax=Bauhinia variegata TaxID=167791 RepID=A0ACB9N198_BAUVA|nr:hypothetical protein L6164_020800 [Bauhinia variegata]
MVCPTEESTKSQNQSSQIEQPSKGTTFFRTCFNGINGMSGIGLLSMPYAFSQGGWLSIILLLVVAILCCYTALLLQRCMSGKPHVKTYFDIGELAFGKKGRALVTFFICIQIYLVAVEFLILEGDNLNKLFPNMMFKIGDLRIEGKKGFVLISALVILPTTWLRNLGLLAYVSAGGVVASIILVCSVFWVGAIDGVGFHQRGELVKLEGFPTVISLFTFGFCGHTVFPTLCNSMKDRSRFNKVLLVCFIASTITYGVMAIQGYLMFGDYVNSQITLNLPLSKISSHVAIYTTLINPFTKYAVAVTPLANAIEDRLCKSLAFSILIRTLIVVSTMLVAMFIPLFGYVMAFIGAFLCVTVSMLLPCICYLKIKKASQIMRLEFIFIIGILFLGFIVAVLGTFISVKQIIKHL